MRFLLIKFRVCITSIVRLFYVKKVGSTDPSCMFPINPDYLLDGVDYVR